MTAFFAVAAFAVLLLAGCVIHPAAKRAGEATSTSMPGTNTTAAPATTPPSSRPMPANSVDPLLAAAARPSAPFEGNGWQSLFDGHALDGWKETAFAGRGEVECRSGLLVLNMGDPLTGVNLTNEFPTMNYEIALDAMRVTGSDFFCGLTTPIGDSFCSLIVGGWGGALVGVSSLDGMDASENETTKYVRFESGHWYRIRMRVTSGRIEAWLDDKKIVDVNTTGKKVSLRPGDIELSKPFGLACYQTTAAMRNIKVRRVDTAADPPKKEF